MPARQAAGNAPMNSGASISELNPAATRPADARPALVWIAVAVVLIGVGAWLGVTLQQLVAAMPGLAPRVPLAADKSYGVNADLTGLTAEELASALARMRAGGLRWVRQPFRWAAIELSPGRFEWQAYDRVVGAVADHGMQLIAVLDTTPAWARPSGSPASTPPQELADFGRFARALAARYGDRLDMYQIWDEPNLSAHWGDRFVDPATYADLLREGAINVRAADPQAFILTAALAPTLETGPLNLNEADFLEQLYLTHAAEWFDVVAAQPYGFAAAPDAPADRQQLNFGRVRWLRQVMERHHDEHKAVWITSFGWHAAPASTSLGASPWPSVTPEQQEAYTAQAIALARREWPWLGPMLAAAWDADRLAQADARRGLALTAGGVWLPTGKAMTGAASDVSASVGWYPAPHPSGQYLGDWRFSTPARSALPAGPPTQPSRADIPRSPPAQLIITFEGTRLDLSVQGGVFNAFLYVTIDDQPANQLPQHAGRAFLGLYDPLEQVTEVTLARYLADGRHTAVIEAEGGWYQWPILGWRVSREADVRAVQIGLVGVGVLASAALGGALISARRLPLISWGAGLCRAYLKLGTPVHGLMVAGSALAFYLAPGTALSLAMLVVLGLAIWLRPDLGLALVAFSIPFFLAPKALVGHTIAMTEVGLVLVASAYVARRVWAALTGTPRRLDWLAWVLTAIAALFAFLTIVPLVQLEGVEIDWPAFALVLLPLAGLLAAWADHQRDQADGYAPLNWRQALLGSSPVRQLDVALAALVVLSLAASLAADNVGVAFQEFHVVVWDAVAFYAFVRLDRRRCWHPTDSERADGIPLVIEALWWGATGMAAYALYLFFFTGYSITAEGVHRALGVYGSPNNLALLLERVVPMLLAVTAFGWPAGSRRDAGRRWSYGLALSVNLVALLLTFSRGALWLGLPAAVLFIGVMRGRRVLAAALAALAVVVASALPLLGSDRLRLLFSGESGTSFFRLRVWQSAWTMLREHPWLGVGPDNFLYQYRTRYMLPDAWQEPNLSHPHNILLDLATRLGVASLAIFIWLQVNFWRLALPLYRHLSEGRPRALLLGLMASMLAGLAHGLVDHALFLVDLAYIFCLTLAVVANTALDTEHVCRG